MIDAPTLLHLVAHEVPVSPRHQIVAPNLIRSQALVTITPALATKAKDVVPLAPLEALTADPE